MDRHPQPTPLDAASEKLHQLLKQWMRPDGRPAHENFCQMHSAKDGCRHCNFRKLMGLKEKPDMVCVWAAEGNAELAITALETAIATREENGYAQR